MARNGGFLDIGKVTKRVGTPAVGSKGVVGQIEIPIGVDYHVLYYGTMLQVIVFMEACGIDLRFLFRVEIYQFGVTAVLEVGYSIVAPAVLVIPQKGS